MSKTLALHGQKFGRLTVVSLAGTDKFRQSRWLCRCDCGNEKNVVGRSLKNGDTKSCGCLHRALVSEANTKHGNSGKPGYNAWCAAKSRCTNPNYIGWANYGGRGIEFRFPDFETFLSHIGPKPSNKHSLDRIDNEGHYEIGNIRWALINIQSRNKRNNRMITYQGETLCMADWAKKLGFSKNVILLRLKRGWSVEKTLQTPIGAKP